MSRCRRRGTEVVRPLGGGEKQKNRGWRRKIPVMENILHGVSTLRTVPDRLDRFSVSVPATWDRESYRWALTRPCLYKLPLRLR